MKLTINSLTFIFFIFNIHSKSSNNLDDRIDRLGFRALFTNLPTIELQLPPYPTPTPTPTPTTRRLIDIKKVSKLIKDKSYELKDISDVKTYRKHNSEFKTKEYPSRTRENVIKHTYTHNYASYNTPTLTPLPTPTNYYINNNNNNNNFMDSRMQEYEFNPNYYYYYTNINPNYQKINEYWNNNYYKLPNDY